MKGGHGRSGPAPQPFSAASERRGGEVWTTLPSAGHRGRIPTFPLPEPTDAERSMWRSVWRKPQAAEWARLGLSMQVAAYVRAFLQSTEPTANAAIKTAVLRMEDSLGISPTGLRALRWVIDESQQPAERASSGVVTPIRRLRAAVPDQP